MSGTPTLSDAGEHTREEQQRQWIAGKVGEIEEIGRKECQETPHQRGISNYALAANQIGDRSRNHLRDGVAPKEAGHYGSLNVGNSTTKFYFIH